MEGDGGVLGGGAGRMRCWCQAPGRNAEGRMRWGREEASGSDLGAGCYLTCPNCVIELRPWTPPWLSAAVDCWTP
jgi:hypothetical protein